MFLLCACKDDFVADFDSPPKADITIGEYDIELEVDPENQIFNSTQVLKIIPKGTTKTIEFDLHSSLVISDIFLKDMNNTTLGVTIWKNKGIVIYERGTEKDIFARYIVEVQNLLSAGNPVYLGIEYRIKPSEIKNTSDNELLKFNISAQGCRALHPVSGFVPFFGGSVVAPFTFKISYPEMYVCCIPGNRIENNRISNYITEKYKTEIPKIPVFYVGPGDKTEKYKDNLRLEYLLAPGQVMADEIAENTFKITELYTQYFGDPGSLDYRVAFVKLKQSSITGESKGNAMYFAYRNPDEYQWDEQGKFSFVNLISHEFFHNWNIWEKPWQGKFYEWFVEGGAGFMASWTCEEILGAEAGNSIRRGFIEGFINNKAYNAVRTLEDATKSEQSERSLIYSYGALVWEQLRQKMGSDNFFTALGNFYKNDEMQYQSFDLLISYLQEQASFLVKTYLEQWLKHNATIDIFIKNVDVQSSGENYETNLEIQVDADGDYEIFTNVGYKTNLNSQLINLDLHITGKGTHKVSFESSKSPVFIQLDPQYRVPQMNKSNDIWGF